MILRRIGGVIAASVIACGIATAADKSEYRVGDRLPKQAGSTSGAASAYQEISWDVLTPADWDPAKDFAALDFSKLEDSDPRAIAALEKLRAAWDHAPIVGAMNGRRIRIPGFMVPLESQKGMVREFLLVPYFGACIHTPPPPANQIIHVIAPKPYKSVQGMDAVWVNGTLEAARSHTGMGSAGYRMKADAVTPYKQ